MQGDPRWITTRQGLSCLRCKRKVRKNEKVFFYPRTKSGYCNGPNCGIKAHAEFEAARQDEDGF